MKCLAANSVIYSRIQVWISSGLSATRVWGESGNVERLRHIQEVHNYRVGTIRLEGGIIISGISDVVFPNCFSTAQSYLDAVFAPMLCIHLQESLVKTFP